MACIWSYGCSKGVDLPVKPPPGGRLRADGVLERRWRGVSRRSTLPRTALRAWTLAACRRLSLRSERPWLGLNRPISYQLEDEIAIRRRVALKGRQAPIPRLGAYDCPNSEMARAYPSIQGSPGGPHGLRCLAQVLWVSQVITRALRRGTIRVSRLCLVGRRFWTSV
jgi:hypothetical protein